MPTKVLILDNYATKYADHLRQVFPDLVIYPEPPSGAPKVDLATIDVMMMFGNFVVDDAARDAFFRQATGLKWVQSLATGVDHFLRCPSLKKETLLTSTTGMHAAPMRETVAFLMLAITHGAPRLVRQQSEHVWERKPPWTLLARKTAVVVGTGVSGSAIANLLKSFGMRVIGVSRTPRPVDGFDEVRSADRLAETAAEADYLVNVLPSSKQTDGSINGAVFAAMKTSAYFINIGRGETVDEPALIAALQEKRIAGAALDVFAKEPLPTTSPLWDMPNVFITPHVGGFFVEYEELALPIIEENMRLFLAGRTSEMRNLIRR